MEMPFKHPEIEYHYTALDHPSMQAAKSMASQSTCFKQRTGAVIVDFDNTYNWSSIKDQLVVAFGNNSVVTPQDSCPRQNMETGTGYELCFDMCGGNLHAEAAAVKDLKERLYPHYGHRLGLFLYGHWWCCEDCCSKMVEAGITNVFLLENSSPETRWF